MKRPWCLGGVGDEGVQLNKEHPLVRRLTADQRAEYLTEVACVESVNGIASQRQTVRTSTKVILVGYLFQMLILRVTAMSAVVLMA